MEKHCIIKILPQNINITAAQGDNIYRVLAESGLLLDGDCGGRATCRRCRIQIKSRNILPPKEQEKSIFSPEQLQNGWRLACLHQVSEDLILEMPSYDAASSQTEFVCYPDKLSADSELAVAVDIGTTSIAGGLIDLHTGAILALSSLPNSQRSFGADIITRIAYCSENAYGLDRLHQAVWCNIADLIKKLIAEVKADASKIKIITLVANSAMSHIAWGLSPESLAQAPYEPLFYHGQEKRADQLPLARYYPAITAQVCLLPNIGGFLGSDTVAAALSCGMQDKKDWDCWTLLLDIGTNGEVVLAGKGRILAASAAAGPAFEGAHIVCGMRATAGALQSVSWEKGDIKWHTIADAPLIGICGSGLLSLIAFLRRQNIINKNGRLQFQESAEHLLSGRLQGEGPNRRFVLQDGIALYQEDIRQFQLAKGAIAACCQILLKEVDANIKDVQQVLLAGAFGNKLARTDAIDVGLLLPIDESKVHYVGNAAWQGAYLAAIDPMQRQAAQALAKEVCHIATSRQAGFQDVFVKSLLF
ncbi:MAG: ASKHA domain-containing protein [Bacillota bacterium]|jgi:uncharacterized 2Fe-2S/4Fe-4S cluster protein (DUF4445 family)